MSEIDFEQIEQAIKLIIDKREVALQSRITELELLYNHSLESLDMMQERITELEAKLTAANEDAHRLYGCINCIQANPQEALEFHRARVGGG